MDLGDTCKICNKSFDDEKGVRRHVGRVHRMTTVDYTITHHFDGKHPTCECGCGGNVAWNKGKPRRFVHGHQHNVPEIVEDMKEKGRLAANDPKKRKKISDKNRKRWKDPDKRIQYEKSLVYARIKRNESIQLLKHDPVWHAERSQKRRDFWASDKGEKARQYMRSEKFATNVSKGTTKALSDPGIRKRLSTHAADLVERGVIGPRTSKCEWKHNPFTDEAEYMHSSWETRFLDWAIRSNVPVSKRHDIRISYTNIEGNSATYIPDFINTRDNVVYEIKGYMSDNDSLKLAALKEWSQHNNFEIEVIDDENDERLN